MTGMQETRPMQFKIAHSSSTSRCDSSVIITGSKGRWSLFTFIGLLSLGVDGFDAIENALQSGNQGLVFLVNDNPAAHQLSAVLHIQFAEELFESSDFGF